eukprot:scaffold1525_cov142-Cylindrotheca_fusiformis.AAC.34
MFRICNAVWFHLGVLTGGRVNRPFCSRTSTTELQQEATELVAGFNNHHIVDIPASTDIVDS